MEQLYILAFDHRNSFLRLMGITPDSVDSEIHDQISRFKKIIYQGFKTAVQDGRVPREAAAILVDEFFGQEILADAGRHGYGFCLPVEKSGQIEFNFEYGGDFAEHIVNFQPTIVKALVRYNPAGDGELNQRQMVKLKTLSQFCRQQKYPFMLESLVPPTPEQLSEVRGDMERYDEEIRPQLMVEMVDQLYRGGVEVDIWKLEGLEKTEQYESLLEHVKADGRLDRRVVILGREADLGQIESWFAAGAKVNGVIGFAVGRTIFEAAIEKLIGGYLDEAGAVREIAGRYSQVYDLFARCRC